ncbi:nucleoside/nucleotide kinase family protein, partial [Streptomyces rochei]|uniref:nucleoside/nucleotide kinase family protein n=1 Tax=Streptomyces rochei TaxID=1928 RepID=UPI00363BDA7B
MTLTFDDLLARARRLPRGGRRAILGIAGSPGAGKSTLAECLVRELNGTGEPWVAHVPMDGFHLADVELDRLGRRERKGAPDTFDAAGYAALLGRLRAEPHGSRVTDGEDPAEGAPRFAPPGERGGWEPLAGGGPGAPGGRPGGGEGDKQLVGTP